MIGQLLWIALNTSAVPIVNAGGPFSLRLRDERVEEITLGLALPFGIGSGRTFGSNNFRSTRVDASGSMLPVVADPNERCQR